MVATRATSAVRVSGPAQPAFDELDPERLLRKVLDESKASVEVIAGSSSALVARGKGQFERGGLVEQDDATVPIRAVVPSTERIIGGKMIYMRKRK